MIAAVCLATPLVLAVFALRMEHFETVVTRSGQPTSDITAD
ncbi:hypothetical protein [Corynebacterium sp. 13CS0277]|nr:hypothetical protein [Corynebacterium sp. 13CS0277]